MQYKAYRPKPMHIPTKKPEVKPQSKNQAIIPQIKAAAKVIPIMPRNSGINPISVKNPNKIRPPIIYRIHSMTIIKFTR